jgi:hypothetical protein
MVVNDDARILNERGALKVIASRLAPERLIGLT